MRKKLSVNAGIAQLEKLAGGATVLALALGATACGFAPSTEPVASPTPAAAVEVAEAETELRGSSDSKLLLTPEKWTKSYKIKAEVKKLGDSAKAMDGCLLSSFSYNYSANATTAYPASCDLGSVSWTASATAAVKKDLKLAGLTAEPAAGGAKDGLYTVYYVYKNGSSANVAAPPVVSTIVFDTTGPEMAATAGAVASKSVTLTVTKAKDALSGYAGGLFVAYAVEAKGEVSATVSSKNVLKTCSVAGKTITCSGLANNKKHRFAVCGLDNVGNVGCSVPTDVYTPAITAPPAAPVVKLGSGATWVNSAQVWSFQGSASADDLIGKYSYGYSSSDSVAPTGDAVTTYDIAYSKTPKVSAKKPATGKSGTAAQPDLLVLAEGVNYLWVKLTTANKLVSAWGVSNQVKVDTVAPAIAFVQKPTTSYGASGQYQISAVVKVTNTAHASGATPSPTLTPVVNYKLGTVAPKAADKTSLTCTYDAVLDDGTYNCVAAFTKGSSAAISLLAQVSDEAGNKSAAKLYASDAGSVDAAITITKDAAPDLTGKTLSAANADGKTTLTLSAQPADADLVGYVVSYAAGSTAPASCDAGSDGGSFDPGTTFEVAGIPSAGYSFRLCAVDLAGNKGEDANNAGKSLTVTDP